MAEKIQPRQFHYPVVALVEHNSKTIATVDRRLGQADLFGGGLKTIAGSQAFRNYSAVTGVAQLNKAGDFRGVVVSAKWRTVFRISSTAGEYLENLGYISGIAAGLAEAAPKIDAILGSSDSYGVKGLQLTAIAGTISERTLLGVIPAGTHLIYKSLEGWCMIAGLLGASGFSRGGIQVLENADTLVQTTFSTVTDTNNQGQAVWQVIDYVMTPRSSKR